MRVSTNPADPAYIDDRPRRVWLNDREIIDWTVADEFRRCVITPDSVLNGAVRIERLPDDAAEPVEAPAPESNNNLCGMLVAVPKAKAEPAPDPSPEPAPSFAVPAVAAKPAAMSAKKRKKGSK